MDVIAALFGNAPFRWYIAGGYALELAVGRSWRPHDDIDIGVTRADAQRAYEYLSEGWDLYVAARGVLRPWQGEELSEEEQENNIWARRSDESPWSYDLVISGGDDRWWWSRRDPSIRLPWADAVDHAEGVPFLAPHAQLLMKSNSGREKDEADALIVIPLMHVSRRKTLAEWLPANHPWQQHLAASRDESDLERPH